MADASQLQLNPYALFDPSQWSNPYSQFQNQALPAASYAGWPTDAMGNPIQAQPGMTINQTPAQPTPTPAAATPSAQNGAFSPDQAMRILKATGQWGLSGGDGRGAQSNQPALEAMARLTAGYLPQQAAAPAAAAPATANSAGLTPQQYMALRANPGPVPTYGATVPQSASSAQPGSGVLQQFLQNWKPAASGPGSGFQQGFSKALKGMGYS
jgi:hypothetical protein